MTNRHRSIGAKSRGVIVGAIALTLGAGLGANILKGQETMVDITEQTAEGYPIIYRRVQERDAKTIIALLDAGADIEARGFFQATPVITAASANSWEIVELLLSRGADPRAVDGKGFNLPWLASTAKMRDETKNGEALLRVQETLAARGFMDTVPHPVEAKALLDAGDWPPKEWP